MNKSELHKSILTYTTMSFSRSSGAGGQNVNKVNTKVHACIEISKLSGLSEEEKVRVCKCLKNIIHNDSICISVQEQRYQEKNREIALCRIEEKIINASFIPKKRLKTKVPKAARERRLKLKKIRSKIKVNRSYSDISRV